MNVFWPAPKIHSGLVAFTRREPPATTATREQVFAVVDAAFAQRRKTLRAALAGWAGGAPQAERCLVAAGVDVCFANPGTSEMHFVAALDQHAGMRCVLGLQENVVTGMADGYWRIAGGDHSSGLSRFSV